MFPNNIIYVKNRLLRKHKSNCSDILLHRVFLPEYFPQHGSGKKHQRKIELVEWQKDIITEYPKDFLKGLMYTDGCRLKTRNVYEFSNKSLDIINLCFEAGSSLGLFPKINSKFQKNKVTGKTERDGYYVRFGKKKDVFFMDEFIGYKK